MRKIIAGVLVVMAIMVAVQSVSAQDTQLVASAASDVVECAPAAPLSAWQWVVQNYQPMFAAIGVVLAGLAGIAKLTPSPKDDGWIASILGWLKLVPVKKP